MLARTVLVVAALALPLGLGCTKKQQLTEVEVPEAGLTLRYDLTPGQTYSGHVRLRSAAQTPVGEIITIVEFDAVATVQSEGDPSKREVEVTVTGIELDIRLPEGMSPKMIPFNSDTAQALDGRTLAFDLDVRGEVSNEPETPQGTDPGEAGLLDLLIPAVTSGISVRLPEETIEDGATWDAAPQELDAEVKSVTSTGTFEGLGRNEAGEDIAKLSFTSATESTRSQGGVTVDIKAEATTKATFSASGGYPVSIERSINNEIVGKATILIEVEAEWSKGGKVAVEAAPQPVPAGGTDVQEITDPCDPDYVGVEECADTAAPADEAASE